MGSFSIWHWLIVLVIVVVCLRVPRIRRIDSEWTQSRQHRGTGRMPVYSAETTNGKEAEFIRDRLPNRFPAVVILVLAVVACIMVWWFTR